jgi:ABC-type amino acid transport substrate-binding protein
MGGYVPDPSINGVEWSQGYYAFGLCLIVRESSAVKKIKHLKGKTVAIYNDPAAEEWVTENIPDVQLKKYSGDSGWFEAIETGEADALIYDYPFAATEIKDHAKTKIVEFNLNESAYAIGVAAKNYDLLDELNQALTQIMASPAYKQWVNTYFAYASADYQKPVGNTQHSYTVRPGETLSIIARKQLKSPDRWKDIWELNKDRIPDPDLIQAGWILVMP